MTELVSKPPCAYEDALFVLKRLRAQGHVAYFAGGCVRDLLLGDSPKDWDVATDAPPKRVRQIFPHTQAVGQAFGVILVKHNRSTVEVATFRSEGTYSDGRRPDSVHFTNAREDASRRDFTINGLFLDPLAQGKTDNEHSDSPGPSQVARTFPCNVSIDNPADAVIDYVGGIADLRARVLRAIGDPDQRFAEDHLRLLRAVRFAARLGFDIDPATAAAIRTNAPRLRAISPERIADELRRMLPAASRARAWRLLWDFALIDIIFRFLPSQEGAEFNPDRSVFLKVAPGREIPFGLALAAGALEYRLGSTPEDPAKLCARPEVHRIGRALRDALKISNDELDEVAGVLLPLPVLLAPQPPALAVKKRFLAMPTSRQCRLLLDAIAARGWHVERIGGLESHFRELEQADVAPPPLITGDDLTAAGLTPGPVFRRVLDLVYDAQLESRVTTREQALELAKESARTA